MSVECRSDCKIELESGRTTGVQVADLREWFDGLPNGATLAPVTHDIGNQRDPWPVLVGLQASWSEER